MSFKISLIEKLPVWDSLPVAKITDYPLEPRDYKPFAQARLCLGPESLWVRMWAFEAIPTETSMLMARFNLFPESSEAYFSLSVAYGGEILCETFRDGHTAPMAELAVLPRVKRFTSEDLQGIYWGVVFELPLTLVPKLYGTTPGELTAGHRVTGNLYKLDHAECGRHYGSFYPAAFPSSDAYTPKCFGDFELVNY